MEIELSLGQMSTADKLCAMETIWEDLAREPSTIPSPAWHEEVLRARQKRIQQGLAKFIDLDEAREQIRNKLK